MKNSVLIIEDNRENIDGLRSMLEDEYEIYIAINGQKGISLLNNIIPDIILLDIGLPDINGFDVLRMIKKINGCENIPVIFITGEKEIVDEEYGLELGASDYIKKPYVPSILKIKIENNIQNKLYRDNLENLVQKRTIELQKSREKIITGMSLLAETRDHETGGHIQRIKKYTEVLVDKIIELKPDMINKKYREDIILYSVLHDIGKVGISDLILLKPGKLTYEEYEIMKSHTTLGSEVLKQTESLFDDDYSSLDVAIEIAESHHEKYDGTGYPHNLVGDSIPLSARIVALADIYDALTSNRPYKKAFSHNDAKDIILIGDGRTMPSHFDPLVLEAFEASLNIFEKIVNE